MPDDDLIAFLHFDLPKTDDFHGSRRILEEEPVCRLAPGGWWPAARW